MSAVAEQLPVPSPIDGPDLANKRAGWRKFPMVMRHPHFQPAVISNDRIVGPDGREQWVNAAPGKSIKLAPVTVLNEAQEEYHAAQGYIGTGDPKAINRAELAPPPPGYVHHEFPRMLEDGTIDEGPDAPKPPDNFYPYWVRMPGFPDELVEDQGAHNELLRKRGVEGPPPPAPEIDPRDVRIASLEDQLAELKALMLARPAPAAVPAQPAPAEAIAPVEDAAQAPADKVEDSTAAEPSAEEAIKARIAELDAELETSEQLEQNAEPVAIKVNEAAEGALEQPRGARKR